MTCAACGIVRCETQPRVLGGETFAICATCDESDDARLLLAVRVPHHVTRQIAAWMCATAELRCA